MPEGHRPTPISRDVGGLDCMALVIELFFAPGALQVMRPLDTFNQPTFHLNHKRFCICFSWGRAVLRNSFVHLAHLIFNVIQSLSLQI
ncbi:hypothetical protein I7I48_08351 [Histoplasma ohiense]|nr:hypothetical protein I7I48_08351 [Histoplasma ohiense (nom. inval.)]